MKKGNLNQSARVIAAGICVLAIGTGIAACGGGDSGSTNTSVNTEGLPDLKGQKIYYLGFGDVVDNAMKEAWFKPFEEATGATVVMDSPTDYAKIETQVKAGSVKYDLVDADPFVVQPGCQKTFAEIKINRGDLAKDAASGPGAPSGPCTAPGYQYSSVVAYDKEKFGANPPKTCQDFFDTEKFPGKRAIWSYYVSGIIECAAIATGANPDNPYPIDLPKAYAKLEAIKDDLVTYDTTSASVDQMQNQDVAMGIFQGSAAADAIQNGAPFEVSDAIEGTGISTWAVPKGAPNSKATQALLDYIFKPDVNPAWVEVENAPAGYSNVTDPVKTAASKGALPDKFANQYLYDWDWWEKNYQAVTDELTKITTG